MKIVIAGAGEMGSHLARMLSGNGHDITIIDSDQKLLSEVGSLADVITVEGDSTTFAVLREASVRKCDLFNAVNFVNFLIRINFCKLYNYRYHFLRQ